MSVSMMTQQRKNNKIVCPKNKNKTNKDSYDNHGHIDNNKNKNSKNPQKRPREEEEGKVGVAGDSIRRESQAEDKERQEQPDEEEEGTTKVEDTTFIPLPTPTTMTPRGVAPRRDSEHAVVSSFSSRLLLKHRSYPSHICPHQPLLEAHNKYSSHDNDRTSTRNSHVDRGDNDSKYSKGNSDRHHQWEQNHESQQHLDSRMGLEHGDTHADTQPINHDGLISTIPGCVTRSSTAAHTTSDTHADAASEFIGQMFLLDVELRKEIALLLNMHHHTAYEGQNENSKHMRIDVNR